MNRSKAIDPESVSRRTVLATATSGGLTIISGCYEDSNTGRDEPVSSDQGEREDDEYSTIRTNLEEIYEEINRFPITENGEFVFDVQEFEANFDFENLLEETRTLRERLERNEPKSDTELKALRAVAKIAELRIRARLATHQAIAAGLSYGNRLSAGEYTDAMEAIRHGRRFLEEILGTARELENVMEEVRTDSLSMDEYEPDSIRDSVSVLLEIVQWSALIYRSFEYASAGFELFESAAERIEEDSVEAARSNFESAGVQFTNALKVFERAHGRGRRLGYVVPLVRKIRCILPIYRDTSDRFADSFTAWNSGEKDEARRMAGEVIENVDQRMARCGDGEAI